MEQYFDDGAYILKFSTKGLVQDVSVLIQLAAGIINQYVYFCMHIPESATMSFWESPLAAKREVRFASPDVGAGMSLLAPLKLAVVESLRPVFTSQLGPPSCTYTR